MHQHILTNDPYESGTAHNRAGFQNALALFKKASRHVPAYKTFLKTMDVNPELIKTPRDFECLPIIDKENYISKFPLKELSWEGNTEAAKYISMSSGSTGESFYWPRGQVQDDIVGQMHRRIYQDIFEVSKGPLLVINAFAIGAWIAGFEYYNAAIWAIEHGTNMTIIAPGIDKNEVIREINILRKYNKRIVLMGYPPFIKDIIELGIEKGLNWPMYDIRLFTGGESFSENWRDHILNLIGQKSVTRGIINLYGMAETGVVGHETPLTILLRRLIVGRDRTHHQLMLNRNKIASLYQYYPDVRYLETNNQNQVLLTSPAGLPLIRYNTRDQGGLLNYHDIVKTEGNELFDSAEVYGEDIRRWQLPIVYLYGRTDVAATLYAVNIYVENIKAALESKAIHSLVTGIFVMEAKHNKTMDQFLSIQIELSRRTQPTPKLKELLRNTVVQTLKQLNAEYRKLENTIGNKAWPRISLKQHSTLVATPGRKHRWVKRG